MPEVERRVVDQPVEYRAAGDGESGLGVLTGYGVVFNSVSRDLGGWFEEIAPEAAGAALEGGALDLGLHTRVICRAEHDSRLLLGTTDAGTLRLFIDETGVRYENDLPDTTAGRDVREHARLGNLRYSSFAFHALDAQWREDAEGRLIRRVTRMTISDMAPVADPAYWAATTGLQKRDIEAVRASLKPEPPAPGEFERAAAVRLRSIQTRLAESASGHRSLPRREKGVRR